MNQPIFIIGAHKSGTSLLRSLLDDHQALNVLPIETHAFHFLGAAIKYPLKQQPERMVDFQDWKKAIKNWIAYCNKNEQRMGGSYAKDLFDESIFNNSVDAISESSDWSQRIEQYFKAIGTAVRPNQDQSNLRVVEKSVEHMEFVNELKAFYPSAKFIHIIRNPYSNLVSLRNYNMKITGKYPSLKNLALSIRDSLHYSLANKRTYPEDYLIVHYEELVKNSDQTIRSMCDFLNIEQTNSLDNPSIVGIPWTGNSAKDKTFEGISEDGLDDWKGSINHLEISFINKSCGSYLKGDRYSMLNKKRSFLPIKKEPLKIYAYNRLALRFLS